MPMGIAEKINITEQKVYVMLRKTPDFDAVFGLSTAIKDGSQKSGDTHSIVRISGDKFLVALSDGMGSGNYAENVSSSSLSLIESFYKAGMDSNLILNTVNKVLSLNTEDTFTALDVSVIDLKTANADFIKFGAPCGFIISDNSVKIVEGNSLPLGILDEVKPTVCKTDLLDGDMLLFLTDGVTDAFGSSSEIIDFIKSQTAKNPQTFADSILERALSLNSGVKKDDMTVLTVRVFRKCASY